MNDDKQILEELVTLWSWPVWAVMNALGPAGLLFAIPYVVASIVIASVAVLGTIWGGVVALFYVLFQGV